MGKDVLGRPAAEIETRAVGQETETGGGQFIAALARQHHVQFFAQRMEMQHIGRGIGDLRIGQRVGCLLYTS